MNICIFGASITHGIADPVNGGWANSLRKYLMENVARFPLNGEHLDVYVLGICGNTTTDLLKRLACESAARESKLIIIAMPTNDTKFNYETGENLVPYEQYQSNVQNLFQTAVTLTRHIAFVGISDIDEKRTLPWLNGVYFRCEDIQRYDKAVEKFCIENSVKYVSLRQLLSPGDISDGLHPNTAGHEKIFKVVVKEIEPFILRAIKAEINQGTSLNHPG